MQLKWLENEFKYDGTQLSSLYAYLNYNILGNSVVSWQGACDISFEHMVDGEDLNAKAQIASDKMVHFIVEYFESDLFFAVSIQRVFASLIIETLKEQSQNVSLTSSLRREGDDIFSNTKKLSISVATKSPVSSLVHFAVNVTNDGTPVETLSLADFGDIDPCEFSQACMLKLVNELESIKVATQKVKWVK